MKLLAALCLLAIAGISAAETIGIRFIVHDEISQTDADKKTVQEKLQRDVFLLNSYFRNSEVNLTAEIVNISFSKIEAIEAVTILADMSLEQNGFSGLFARASEFGADYTLAITGNLMINGRRGCGRAIGVNKTVAEISSTRRSLAVLDYACGAQTLAHELGHLMGLNHGNAVDACSPGRGHTTALKPYANGYGEGECNGKSGPEKFGTIMVGGWMKEINGNGHSSLPMFSNPRIRDLRCGKSGVCGDPMIGDAARVLNEHAKYYAAHEEPEVQALAFGSSQLEHCVRSRYAKIKVSQLIALDCRNYGIETLDGIERLTALRKIDLNGNRLVDIAPLLALGKSLEQVMLLENSGLACASNEQQKNFAGAVLWPEHCKEPR